MKLCNLHKIIRFSLIVMKSSNVEMLINGKFDIKYDDKVFWFAKYVEQREDNIDIFIDNRQGLTAFDDIATELNIPTVNDLAQCSKIKIKSSMTIYESVLISSGSFLWINNKLLLLQRTENTKYDPLAWTTPAGRCDRTPFVTGIKETIEEIKIQNINNQTLWYPQQAKEYNSDKTIRYFDSEIIFKNKSIKLTNVRTWLDNTLIEECQLWYMYNQIVNTFEFRIPLYGIINEKVSFSNPEYNMDVKAVDKKELFTLKVVPAVEKLRQQMDFFYESE